MTGITIMVNMIAPVQIIIPTPVQPSPHLRRSICCTSRWRGWLFIGFEISRLCYSWGCWLRACNNNARPNQITNSVSKLREAAHIAKAYRREKTCQPSKTLRSKCLWFGRIRFDVTFMNRQGNDRIWTCLKQFRLGSVDCYSI